MQRPKRIFGREPYANSNGWNCCLTENREAKNEARCRERYTQAYRARGIERDGLAIYISITRSYCRSICIYFRFTHNATS